MHFLQYSFVIINFCCKLYLQIIPDKNFLEFWQHFSQCIILVNAEALHLIFNKDSNLLNVLVSWKKKTLYLHFWSILLFASIKFFFKHFFVTDKLRVLNICITDLLSASVLLLIDLTFSKDFSSKTVPFLNALKAFF